MMMVYIDYGMSFLQQRRRKEAMKPISETKPPASMP
jgi:hypothetical protein